ncbi:centromere protein M isoform X6 [Prionailurus viverrinus]|uniref:centromere protein M isoform X6 n=1 Tax=Prionailurus viverrinus TaxID=61388 RepID=UPI001FF2070C|nr:centromere protein M isoform X6 [Prionailurus viverrinus]
MVFPASLGSGLPKQSLGQLRSAVQTVLERVHSEPSTGAWRSPLSLVGTEDALLQQLADSMLKEDCASELRVHLARSLPLPSSVDRPRIDLIVFVVNLHSKYSLRNVEESLHHVDATFFLGKAAFLATGAGRESHCSVHRNTIVKLAHTYRSPLFFCDLEDAEAWGTREVPALPDFPHNIPQKPKTSRGEATRSVIQLGTVLHISEFELRHVLRSWHALLSSLCQWGPALLPEHTNESGMEPALSEPGEAETSTPGG